MENMEIVFIVRVYEFLKKCCFVWSTTPAGVYTGKCVLTVAGFNP